MSTLFVAAIEEETAALSRAADVVHVGVGKVQAATTLARVLAERGDMIDLVVNLGTAGGLHAQPLGTIVEVARVHQHDLDVAGIVDLLGRRMPGGPIDVAAPAGTTGRLATGDRLIADPADRARLALDADVVDMEGYAIAAVCRAFDVPLRIVKAVSDGADGDAATTWHDALERCAQDLAAWVAHHGPGG